MFKRTISVKTLFSCLSCVFFKHHESAGQSPKSITWFGFGYQRGAGDDEVDSGSVRSFATAYHHCTKTPPVVCAPLAWNQHCHPVRQMSCY